MKCILVITLLAIHLSTQSQTVADSVSLKSDTSYFTTKPNHTFVKTAIIGAGYSGFCFLSYKYLDENIKNFTQANQNKPLYYSLQTAGYLGLTNSNIAITACTGVAALITKNPRFQKATILLAGSQLLNGFITKQIKYTFQRHRPNTGDAYNTFDWRGGPRINLSFVSGHASDAFATATAFAICFSNKKWVPVVAYSVAGIVSISRIYQNEHWTSDVLAGAAIGFLSTQTVNKLYNIASRKFIILPAINNGHLTASAIYKLK